MNDERENSYPYSYFWFFKLLLLRKESETFLSRKNLDNKVLNECHYTLSVSIFLTQHLLLRYLDIVFVQHFPLQLGSLEIVT